MALRAINYSLISDTRIFETKLVVRVYPKITRWRKSWNSASNSKHYTKIHKSGSRRVIYGAKNMRNRPSVDEIPKVAKPPPDRKVLVQ